MDDISAVKSLARELAQLVVVPPGLRDVPVRDDAAPRARRKAGAEHVYSHFGAVPLQRQDRIPVAILQRFALLVQSGVAQPFAALLIAKRHRDVQ